MYKNWKKLVKIRINIIISYLTYRVLKILTLAIVILDFDILMRNPIKSSVDFVDQSWKGKEEDGSLFDEQLCCCCCNINIL
jgi:hypothetical protein